MSTTPQVPSGFELDDSQQQAPKPPAGFELESAPPPEPLAVSHKPPKPTPSPAQELGIPAPPNPILTGPEAQMQDQDWLQRLGAAGLAAGSNAPLEASAQDQGAERAAIAKNAEAHVTGASGYPKMAHAIKEYREANSYADPNAARSKAGTELLQGAGEAATPLMILGGATAPARTLLGLGEGYVASQAAGAVADTMGASPETKDFVKTAGWFIPNALTQARNASEILDATLPRGFVSPEGDAAAVEGVGGKVRAGVARTPEGIKVAGRVGRFKGGFTVPGTAPAAEVPGIEPPTIPGEPAAAKPPTPPPMPPEVADAARAAGVKARTEQAAAQVVRGVPPVEPPPPPPMVNDATVAAVGQAIQSLPKDQQPAAILEATQKAAESILHHGGAVVDGEVHTATTPEQALKVAKKVMDGQIAKADEAATSQNAPSTEVAKPEVKTPTSAKTTDNISAPEQTTPQPPAGFEVDNRAADRRSSKVPIAEEHRQGQRRLSEMSKDELIQFASSDYKSGGIFQNEAAWKEREKQPHIASTDVDGLGAINDKYGHAAGDALLRAWAESFKKAGLKAYRVGGDEVWSQGQDKEQLQAQLEQARNHLRNATFHYTKPDGSQGTLTGVDFSYGIGPDEHSADRALYEHKNQRAAVGERPKQKGELPRGIHETDQVNGRHENVEGLRGESGPGTGRNEGPVRERPGNNAEKPQVAESPNRQKFREAYTRHLTKAVQEHPEEYSYGAAGVPKVVEKMVNSIAKGGANLNSRAIKATAKELGIKPTKAALQGYLTAKPDTKAPAAETKPAKGETPQGKMPAVSSEKGAGEKSVQPKPETPAGAVAKPLTKSTPYDETFAKYKNAADKANRLAAGDVPPNVMSPTFTGVMEGRYGNEDARQAAIDRREAWEREVKQAQTEADKYGDEIIQAYLDHLNAKDRRNAQKRNIYVEDAYKKLVEIYNKPSSEPNTAPAKGAEAKPQVQPPEGFELEHKYRFGNTQVRVPTDLSSEIESLGDKIPTSDLMGDGRQSDFHVTLKYGLHAPDQAVMQLRDALADESAVHVTLGEIESFPPSEHSDNAAPIVVRLSGASMLKLRQLKNSIAKYVDAEPDSFPDYKPHITIAYVKPDRADAVIEMLGADAVSGRTFAIDRILVTDRGGNAEVVKLGGAKQEPERPTFKDGDKVRWTDKNGTVQHGQIVDADAKSATVEKFVGNGSYELSGRVENVKLENLEKFERPADNGAGKITPVEKSQGEPITALIDAIHDKLSAGDSLGNVTELNKLAADYLGAGWRTSGKITPKDVFDAMEAGVNKYLLDRGADLMGMDAIEGLKELRELMPRLTSQGVRTEEQIKAQQFSTPPTESYVAAKVADIKPSDVVLEPSAGNGGLAVWAKAIGAEVHVNEIAERRQKMLEAVGFGKPTAHDGELINSYLDPKIKPSVVIMNPPFSAGILKGENAKNKNQYGFNHVESALQRLEQNGRLVAILGGGREGFDEGASLTAKNSREWFQKIAKKYNIRANVRVHGKEYGKYGTTYATRLIVIDKDGPTKGGLDGIVQGSANTLEEAYNLLRPVAESRPQVAGGQNVGEALSGRPGSLGQGEPGGGLVTDTNPRVPGVRNPSGAVGSPHAAVPAGSGSGRSGPNAAEPLAGGGTEQLPVPQQESGPQASPEGKPAGRAGGGAENGEPERQVQKGGLDLEQVEATKQREQEEEKGSAYVAYRPSLKGGEHPGAIVETKAMATVPMPPLTYKPNLPESVVGKAPDYKDAKLSAVQLEAVAIAGMQNEIILPNGARAAALIGDGTGVGKGREGAAIIWDNWRKGRKRLVWMTKSKDLIDAAVRDLSALGATDLAKGILNLGKLEASKPIQHEGVLFTTYALFRSADKKGNTRALQVDKWLRGDDNGDGGYFLFDESHLLKNAVVEHGAEASQIGETVKKFLEKMPNLRTVSLSATAATDVMNLGYMDRLGLWGPGTPFPGGFVQFAAEIAHGGMSAMEMIARELKAQGKYVARTLTFRGVRYSELEHEITPEQAKIYDSAAEAWKMISDSIERTIEDTTNGGGRQRAMAMSQFYSTQQRFFSLLLTSLKVPTAVKAAEEALAQGKAVGITLINTNEAAQSREKNRVAAEESGEEPDYDFGPGRMLSDMVREHYPVQQYADAVDSNGNPVKVAVFEKDENGNDTNKPVLNPEAVKARDELIAKLEKNLHMPANPLDDLIEQLGGPSKVAELTGRKQRYDPIKNRLVNRAGEGVSHDKINRNEMANFQSGKKLIAVLSSAADTGISLHSDLGDKNQRPRYVITLQVGWSADKALQMLGRFNRTNQANAPEYALLKSNLGGESRFISSIARRMESLEALSRGQTKTNSGTEAMSKVNFETDQGRAATVAFYNQLLRNIEVPGTADKDGKPLRGMDVLTDLGVLKETPSGVTVPQRDRDNITRLLNRLLALPTKNQNAVYDYFYNIFDAVVQKAIEDGTIDTGVKRIPGDSFDVKDFRELAADPSTGAKTYYYPVEAHERVERMPAGKFDDLLDITDQQGKHPIVMRDQNGNLALTVDAREIVQSDGKVIEARHMMTPQNASPVKVPAHELARQGFVPVDQEAREKLEQAQREADSAKGSVETYKDGLKKAKEDKDEWSIKWYSDNLKRAEERLDQARKTRQAAKKEIAGRDYLDQVRADWQKQYEAAPDHKTVEHHLIGGAVMRFWNAIRENTGHRLDVYSTVDQKTGQRVVGVEIPPEKINSLLNRITGGQSQVDENQIVADVLKNGTRYDLEGGIAIRRGRVGRDSVVQLVTSNEGIQRELKRLGVLHEIGVQPIYYLPGGRFDEGPAKAVLAKILQQYPVKQEGNSEGGANLGSQRGAVPLGAILSPVTVPYEMAKKLGAAWDKFSDSALQKAHLGRPLPEVEKVDPQSAALFRQYRAAPQYYRIKADHIVRSIVGGLSREQEKGFVLLADQASNDWLNENHHDEWLKYQDDPDIEEALGKYRPYESQLREAQRALGGPVIEEDYLRRVYTKHVAGVGKEHGGASEGVKFDRVVTPQMANKKGRMASPEYYYKYGLHEFGPSFASRYIATHLKLLESAIAADFMSKATKLDQGDSLPAFIDYNGERYFSPEAIKLIKMSRSTREEGKQIAEELGLEQLPKPGELKPYAIYTPFTGSRLEFAAQSMAENAIRTGEQASRIKPSEMTIEDIGQMQGRAQANAGQGYGVLHNLGIKYLGPREIVDAMERDGRDIVPQWVRDWGKMTGPLVGAIRQQLLITGIPHIKNILRRVMQNSPGAQLDPRSWYRAWRILFSKELKERALMGPGDPTFDALLKHAGISDQGVISYDHYLNWNFTEGNWKNLWHAREAVEEAFSEPGVKGKLTGVSRLAGEAIRAIPTSKVGKWWHDQLFGPGGLDPRARIYLADLIRSQEPGITDAELAERLNDQLGRYARSSWTDLHRAMAPFMMFPGWNYSSANWVLKHPLRSVLPAAFLILLANMVLRHYHKNREKDKTDYKRLHVGGRSWSDTLFRERLAMDDPLVQIPLDYAQAKLRGKRSGEALGIALSGLTGDAGALLGEANPLVTLPIEVGTNKRNLYDQRALFNRRDFRHRGKVIPEKLGGKGTEGLIRYGAGKVFPQIDLAYPDEGRGMDPLEFLGRNVGTSNFSDRRGHKGGSGLFSLQGMGDFANMGALDTTPEQPQIPEGFELDTAPGQEPDVVPPAEGEPIEQKPEPEVKPKEISHVGKTDSDSGRKVMQPKTTADANQRLATAAYPELASRLSRVAASVPGAQFERIRPQKDQDRLAEKTDDKPPKTISDYVAAQVAIDTPRAKDQMLSSLRRSFKVVDVEDKFTNGRPDKAGYASTNVQVQLSNGATAEIQLVPKEVQEVGAQSHPFYEAGREAEERGDNEERDRQWAKAAELNQDALARFKDRNRAVAKGDTVTLRDGSRGEVAYVHPQMNIARVRAGGRTRTVNLSELSHA